MDWYISTWNQPGKRTKGSKCTECHWMRGFNAHYHQCRGIVNTKWWSSPWGQHHEMGPVQNWTDRIKQQRSKQIYKSRVTKCMYGGQKKGEFMSDMNNWLQSKHRRKVSIEVKLGKTRVYEKVLTSRIKENPDLSGSRKIIWIWTLTMSWVHNEYVLGLPIL